MDPHIKFSFDVKIDDAIHIVYERIITYIMKLSGDSRARKSKER